MIRRTRAAVEELLAQAEAAESCAAALSRVDLRRLRTAVQEGRAVEVCPSVFADAEHWGAYKPSQRMRMQMRALQQLHPDWVFAGPSAAVAYGLAVSNRHLDNVWVATSRDRHQRNLPWRRFVAASHAQTCDLDGLRVVSLARAVGDCLRIMSFRSGLAVADSALRVANATPDQLAEAVGEACPRMPGLPRVRALLALSDARAESGGESIARGTMLELGIACPELQHPFERRGRGQEAFRVDFAWRVGGQLILGEFDGNEKYLNASMTKGRDAAQVIGDEHRRQSWLEARPEVLRVVRFGFADVKDACGFLDMLMDCGVPRTYARDDRVVAAGGILRCREPYVA